MNEDAANPYAPPPTLPDELPEPSSLESLRAEGPISFAGHLTDEDLIRYLRGHDHVGCGSMFSTAFALLLIVLAFSIALGGAAALIFVGFLGWFGLMFVTSLLPYRRSVFSSHNPRWSAKISGELSADGLTVDRGDTRATFRWDWFGGAIVGDQVVAFIPALHPHQPLILTPTMVRGLEDWDRLVSVARLLASAVDPMSTRESRRFDNRVVLGDKRRTRTIEVPDGAVPFEGVVSTEDLRHVPPLVLRRDRPRRAYALLAGLAVFAGLVAVGSARLVGLDSLVAILLLSVFAFAILLTLWLRNAWSGPPGETIYFLTAFADDTGITSDFAVTTTHVPWSSMKIAHASDQLRVLSRPETRQVIIGRRDMFANEEAWQAFCQMVQQQLGGTAGD